MKNKFFQGAALIFLIAIAAPYLAFADHNPIKTNVFDPTILGGPLLVCVGADGLGGTAIPKNCENLCDLVAQIANVLYFMIGVVIWIIVPILVAIGGIMIMIGGANPEMVGRGKKTITGAVIGLVIILCAWLIVFTFVSAFGNLGKYVGGFGGSSGQAACQV